MWELRRSPSFEKSSFHKSILHPSHAEGRSVSRRSSKQFYFPHNHYTKCFNKKSLVGKQVFFFLILIFNIYVICTYRWCAVRLRLKKAGFYAFYRTSSYAYTIQYLRKIFGLRFWNFLVWVVYADIVIGLGMVGLNCVSKKKKKNAYHEKSYD